MPYFDWSSIDADGIARAPERRHRPAGGPFDEVRGLTEVDLATARAHVDRAVTAQPNVDVAVQARHDEVTVQRDLALEDDLAIGRGQLDVARHARGGRRSCPCSPTRPASSPLIESRSTFDDIVAASTEPNTWIERGRARDAVREQLARDVLHRDRARRAVELAAGIEVLDRRACRPRSRRRCVPCAARGSRCRCGPRHARDLLELFAAVDEVAIRTRAVADGTSETRRRSSVSSSGACLRVSIWIALPS